jgi:heme exporter protein A
VIHVRNLKKRYRTVDAVRGLSFDVLPGQILGLVGPNGAGKTTLLRILATLTRPTSGDLLIAGLDPTKAGEAVRQRIGFLSHRTLLYEDLTAEQNLRFYAQMYDLADGPARVGELLERVGLVERRHDLVRTFSRGMQQRLAVARAVLPRPQVLLLDEPYTGLDVDAAQALTDLLGELVGAGCATLLTTHDLERGVAAADRVLVLARGRIVHDEPCRAIALATFSETYRTLTAT